MTYFAQQDDPWDRNTLLFGSHLDQYLQIGLDAQTASINNTEHIKVRGGRVCPISVRIHEDTGYIAAYPEVIDRLLNSYHRIWVTQNFDRLQSQQHEPPTQIGQFIRQVLNAKPKLIIIPITIESMRHEGAIIIFQRADHRYQATFFDPIGFRGSLEQQGVTSRIDGIKRLFGYKSQQTTPDDPFGGNSEWKRYRDVVVQALGGERNVVVQTSKTRIQTDMTSCVPVTADFLAHVILNPRWAMSDHFPDNIIQCIFGRNQNNFDQYTLLARCRVLTTIQNGIKGQLLNTPQLDLGKLDQGQTFIGMSFIRPNI